MLYLWEIKPKTEQLIKDLGRDTFKSAIVVSKDEESARRIHPNVTYGRFTSEECWAENKRLFCEEDRPLDWLEWVVVPGDVEVTKLGIVTFDQLKEGQVFLADYWGS